MKKLVSLLLALVMVLACTNALALNYSGNLGNEATFETMAEVKQNAPEAMKAVRGSGNYGSHPAMEGYPDDYTYVYRSSDQFGRNNAARCNTNIVVYVDEFFESKDDAFEYIKNMGLVDIIEDAKGAVILVTPNVPYGVDSSGNAVGGFTSSDQKYYYALQTAMFALGASGTNAEGQYVSYYDGNYYGGYGFYYVIGINGGATFLNDYVAGMFDFVSRIAGMLLINGDMERVRTVAAPVPVFLVNAPADVIAKYEAANETDALEINGSRVTSYNQQFPVRKVVYEDIEDVDLSTLVPDAYYNMLCKAVRGQEMKGGLYSGGTPYQGYGADCAPYSLSVRNALIGGKTVDGIVELRVDSEELAQYVGASNGEYLQTWYEYIPQEVLDGNVAPGTVPMIMAIHGGGDDPRQYVDGQGYLELAGKERLIVISPEKANLHVTMEDGEPVLSSAIPALVRLIEEKYPEVDASRVYVTGYSMGSLATLEAIFGDPSVFAAAYPQAGIAGSWPTEKQLANFEKYDIPCVISTSEYDSNKNVDPANKGIVEEFYNLLSELCILNGMDPLPETADYDAYPNSGFKADIYTRTKTNGEYTKHSWYMVNDDGVPMVGLTFTDDIVHCLYPEYAQMVWDYCKHFSRDLETGEVIYNPYVR